MATMCQSLLEDETPCDNVATKVVRGRPGYLWRGVHCDGCAERVSKMFDHQGGCIVEPLVPGLTPVCQIPACGCTGEAHP